MTPPLVEGEPVLLVWVLTRATGSTLTLRAAAAGLRVEPSPVDVYVGHRVIRAVVSSTVIDSVVQARERPLGRNLRALFPANEGITWCRGWSREARDALSAAWSLARAR